MNCCHSESLHDSQARHHCSLWWCWGGDVSESFHSACIGWNVLPRGNDIYITNTFALLSGFRLPSVSLLSLFTPTFWLPCCLILLVLTFVCLSTLILLSICVMIWLPGLCVHKNVTRPHEQAYSWILGIHGNVHFRPGLLHGPPGGRQVKQDGFSKHIKHNVSDFVSK